MFGIPHLHPLFVHYPVAFLILAAGTASLWLALGTPLWRQMTAVLLLAGTLGAFAAYYTGDDMADAFAKRPAVKALVDRHEDAALWTLIAAGVAGGAFIAASIQQASVDKKGLPGPDRKALVRTLLLLLALAAAGLVAYTGHLGGTMTWSTAYDKAPAQVQAPTSPAPQNVPAKP